MPKVSAIVSTYNSERFLRGRIENLLAQTLYAKGELEIIVVNAGSRQGERYIIRDYLGCVTYIESLREPIYASWNRGIAISKGQYITNANADDRLRDDALELMAEALDDLSDVALVYTNAIVTCTENATWQKHQVSDKPPYFGQLAWPDFDIQTLFQGYYGGPNPMWRRALHERYGLFDDSFQLAGDYEFALRLAIHGERFVHIARPLTLFYDNGVNINEPEQAAMEARRAMLRWGGCLP